MKNKITIIFVCLMLMFTTTIIIIPNDINVKATSGEEIELDYNFIKNIAEDLSFIINNSEIYPNGTLAKGREFGSDGEHHAAELLQDRMQEMDLYNPIIGPKPYLDQIEDNWYPGKFFISGGESLTSKINITARQLTLKHNGTPTLVDCFIQPLTNGSRSDLKIDKSALTGNYIGSNLIIYNESKFTIPIFIEEILEIINNTIQYIINNYDFTGENPETLVEIIESILKNISYFAYENIDPDDNTTWPPFIVDIGPAGDFVTIAENPIHNPKYSNINRTTGLDSFQAGLNNIIDKLHFIKNIIIITLDKIQRFIFKKCYNSTCKGHIYYDYTNESYDQNLGDSYSPTMYINGTIGKMIMQDVDDNNGKSENYTIDYILSQTFMEDVESYNVIGQINGTDQNKNLIIDSFYDGFWNEATSDSAVGCGIVLTIAKHMKELENMSINPKYKTKIILFGGEEWGYKGAQHYAYDSLQNLEEDIEAVIDLNQLGMKIINPETDPPCIMNLIANTKFHSYLLENIAMRTKYQENTGFEIRKLHAPLGTKSNDNAFAMYIFENIKTVSFLKDTGWYNHHRDGINHTEGDVMKNIDWEDIENTTALAWNVIKYYDYDPDVWFNNDPTFTFYDTNNDGKNDCLNVTYSMDTNWPCEQVSTRLVLYPKYTISNPCLPMLYRCRSIEHYNITPGGLNGYINITLPANFPTGDYNAELYLCNSTGDITLDTLFIMCNDTLTNGLGLIELLAENLSKIANELLNPEIGEYLENIGINIVDWVNKLQNINNNRTTSIVIDLLGYNIFGNQTCKLEDFEMYPPNNPPNTPETPTELETDNPLKKKFQTRTTDLESGDKIQYQWDWDNGLRSLWSPAYNQSEYHNITHTWLIPGERTIRVRAKNPNNPNAYSPWSETPGVNTFDGCLFEINDQQSGQGNINNPYIINSFEPDTTVVGQNINLQGTSYGLAGNPTYTYNANNEWTKNEQNPTYVFNTTGMKYINLTVNTTGKEVYYNKTINAVNTKPCYNMNQYAAQTGQTIYFTDTSITNLEITNYTWDTGDGNTKYTPDMDHVFTENGIYRVSLNTKNTADETTTFWQDVYVENNPPEIVDTTFTPTNIPLGDNVTFYTEIYDDSGIKSIHINITKPDFTYYNNSMVYDENNTYGYQYVFNNTNQTGWYYFNIYVIDNANNQNDLSGCAFQVSNNMGYTLQGTLCQNTMNVLTGSNYNMMVNGAADSINAFVQNNPNTETLTGCILYQGTESYDLLGTTEEILLNPGTTGWVTYNFTEPKPLLTKDKNYILTFWSNNTCNLTFDNTTDGTHGYNMNQTYGEPPENLTPDDSTDRSYSIYCGFKAVPETINTYITPNNPGLGENITINAIIEHNGQGIQNLTINITTPDNTTHNNTMTSIGNETYQHVFQDTWKTGVYNYTIWMNDQQGGTNYSNHSFNITATAEIHVCTIQDVYGENTTINLTDPPGGTTNQNIGYELLENNTILHMYNQYDSYYFNTSNGVQFTNHLSQYWSHNVLMLGYYNNNIWHLIYRTDELTGFNKNINTDNTTFVNATLWKNLTYNGYDFQLAIRYHLGVDDNELTIIPYIKNIDNQNIPYILGFAWELNDIQINNTPENDYIEINGTCYMLNTTLDETYTNMTTPCYYIMENITNNMQKSLYLRWDENLDYIVKIESRTGEYNAPVTLGIKIGTLQTGEEKYTELYWYDANQLTYYFNGYDTRETWTTNPNYMVDGNTGTYASTNTNGDIQICDNNTCNGTDIGPISKLELRVNGYYTGYNDHDIILRPIYNGDTEGSDYAYDAKNYADWSEWFEIPNEPGGPSTWSWTNVKNLDCKTLAENKPPGGWNLYCSKIEIRITYNPYPVTITNNYPTNNSNGIPMNPMLNITVTDTFGRNMNITWLSNNSGSWQIFGTNNTVVNGTYHQTFANATVNGQYYFWKVNVTTPDNGYNESDIFRFYTGYQSKIENTGSTNISGYLLIQVQYYNTSLSSWIVANDTVNESSMRTINSSETLGLDTIFNGLINSSDLLNVFGNGTYRIYAAFRDPVGDVLVCNDDSLLQTTYEFTINYN